ncbi:hypothetical protein ABZZ80_42700, partial [Streptomyces sp. NPDC006356]
TPGAALVLHTEHQACTVHYRSPSLIAPTNIRRRQIEMSQQNRRPTSRTSVGRAALCKSANCQALVTAPKVSVTRSERSLLKSSVRSRADDHTHRPTIHRLLK